MSFRVHSPHGDLGSRFNEDAPRPPVPGEEDMVPSTQTRPRASSHPAKGEPTRGETSAITPRRSDLDLGYEPEGSASPPPAHLRWAESLHSLLDDEDGTALFRSFLQLEASVDLLDFWFACSGFRKLPAAAGLDGRRLKLAKVIYRKYIADGGRAGVVARKIKPATKAFIRGCVIHAQLDLALFDQAQVEVQALMEDHAYPLFLKSDIYLDYARSATESSPRSATQLPPSPGNRELPSAGHLPTLMEEEEWAEPERDRCRLTQRLLMETAPHRNTANRRGPDHCEARSGVKVLVNPYYVNSGFTRAPLTSANDSELQSQSSDADTISLTDSSIDGIPPYQIHKHQRRHVQESVRANGHVSLPHMPRTHRMPKEIHVEPQRFAAELISRLELVQRERENLKRLEERLQRVRMEEECNDADVSTATSLSTKTSHAHVSHRDPIHAVSQWRDTHDEDPESILDDHVQRVMKTPGCQSPRNPTHTQKQPHHAHTQPHTLTEDAETRNACAWNGASRYYGNRGRCYSDGLNTEGTGHNEELYSSRLNSLSRRNGQGKSDERRDIDGRGLDGRGLDGRGPGNPEEAGQKQKILQWMLEGEREGTRHRKSSSCIRGWANGSDRYEPGSTPNPNQLEEARRRSAPQHSRQRLKPSGRRGAVCDVTTEVAYYFCGELIPYLTMVKGRPVTLRQFKELLPKKETYRFYFKKVSDEFDCGVVYEEVREDDAVLPVFQDRIIGKVERID